MYARGAANACAANPTVTIAQSVALHRSSRIEWAPFSVVAMAIVEDAILGVAVQRTARIPEAHAGLAVQLVSFAILVRIDDAIAAIRAFAVGTAGVGFCIGVGGAVIALLGALDDTVAAHGRSAALAGVEPAIRGARERPGSESRGRAGEAAEVASVPEETKRIR